MCDSKLVKIILDAGTLTGIAAVIGWVSKKVLKENMTADPSASGMNYGWRHRAETVSPEPEYYS